MKRKIDIKGCLYCLSLIVLLFVVMSLLSNIYGQENDMVWGASLYEDPKASRIGDLVTILIVEDSKAEQSYATARGKEANLAASTTGALDRIPPFSAQGMTEYKGDLSTTRATEVKATLTAMVTSIYPNGNLFVEGTKNTKVNGERMEVSVTGIIRPLDIQVGNIITSDYIANSNIEYKGMKKKGFWKIWKKIVTFPFRLLEPLF